MALTDSEKRAMLFGPVRREMIKSGKFDNVTFNDAVAKHTGPDGTIDWAGLTAFIIAIMPLIESLISALGG